MVNLLIIIGVILLLVFLAFKMNNLRTRVAYIFIILGISFLLLTGYLVFSGKDVDVKTFNGISSTMKTYFSWLGHAGSNVLKISSYAFKQDWSGDKTNSTS